MSRMLFGVAALLLCGVLLATAAPQAPLSKIPLPPVSAPPGSVDPHMPMFQVCAKDCDDCARMCDICAAHCATMLAEGKKEHLSTLRSCQDCAAICMAAARVTGKDGPMSDLICTSCADSCKRCGDACKKFSSDPIMKQCTNECRKCETACRDMLKMPRK